MPTHPLLRGARWRLARPHSHALWTSASPTELAALFDDAELRHRTEAFLRLVAATVDGIETLLVFDAAAVDLALAVSLGHPVRWDWLGHSLATPPRSPPAFDLRAQRS